MNASQLEYAANLVEYFNLACELGASGAVEAARHREDVAQHQRRLAGGGRQWLHHEVPGGSRVKCISSRNLGVTLNEQAADVSCVLFKIGKM